MLVLITIAAFDSRLRVLNVAAGTAHVIGRVGECSGHAVVLVVSVLLDLYVRHCCCLLIYGVEVLYRASKAVDICTDSS